MKKLIFLVLLVFAILPVQARGWTMFKIYWWDVGLELSGGVSEEAIDGLGYLDIPSIVLSGPNLRFWTAVNSGWDEPSIEWLIWDFRAQDGQPKYWQALLWLEQDWGKGTDFLIQTEVMTDDNLMEIWGWATGDNGLSYPLFPGQFFNLPPSPGGYRLDIYSAPVPEPATFTVLVIGLTFAARRWRRAARIKRAHSGSRFF